MAAKWQDVKGGGDSYNLQYRTAGDNRVREEHAALNGTTLPADDPFWRSYYPPNGWMCRCNVVEVRKEKFPESDSKEAIRRGDAATDKRDRFGNNKGAIFRFNPGAQERIFPEKHPYFPKGCGDCEYKSNLAYRKDNPKCQACQNINNAYGYVERRDIHKAMENLKGLSKSQHREQLIAISQMKSFKPMKDYKGVFIHATDSKDADLKNLKDAAGKAVKHKYTVYILPNLKGVSSADFIFERKGFYAVYELKTIEGKNSADNRLGDSGEQANRTLLNMATEYDPRGLAKAIKGYFNGNKEAEEVLIFKDKEEISVKRKRVQSKDFVKQFVKEYRK